jgi:hypothetical protein
VNQLQREWEPNDDDDDDGDARDGGGGRASAVAPRFSAASLSLLLDTHLQLAESPLSALEVMLSDVLPRLYEASSEVGSEA